MTIIYESKRKVISKRTIHIVAVRDEFIIAYCYLRQQIRRFKWERILGFEMEKTRGNNYDKSTR